ncbi:MAG: hypothetical protein NC342_07325 [Pseudoflavonifractor sp.]|nr:4-(cytidine 5'-diphospho)-2-C-methyl-D-erythritol kinase [Alloprevotella sp.]MCM1117329.1 hypothetical protein [Pseudoflavonifractor sp.]
MSIFAAIMIVFPNAKINLGLRITSRRPDGYHMIESLMVALPWHDVLEGVAGQGPSHTLTVTGRQVDCPVEKNLVMKSISALEAEIREPLPPLDLYLRKIIPDGAGLGGGSADATFAIKLVDSLLSLGLTEDRLCRVAAKVGADCPFFIYNKVSSATGIGTDLTPSASADEALRKLSPIVVVAKPPESISTREAYAGITPRPLDGPLPWEIVSTLPPKEWETAGLVNDFESTVAVKCPSVKRIKEKMQTLGAIYCSMSGSGSAVYGLFDKGSDILSAPLDEIFPKCDTMVSPLFPKMA